MNTSATPAVSTSTFQLERDPFGKLVLTNAQGERFDDVAPVRAFPLQAPEEGISFVNSSGREVAWADALGALPPSIQALVRHTLALREFIPVITAIVSTTSFSTPCTWSVETDRGPTAFVLRGDEDIRRIGKDNALLIADVHGIQYLIRDQFALDALSKKILDRFL